MEFQNSQTAKHLREALSGEAIAESKYLYFSQKAREYGDEDVAETFERLARNERMHARLWYDILYRAPESTKECLLQAAKGEYNEWHDMYPRFAQTAREEGFEQIAVMLDKVAEIERTHENTFLTMLARLNRSNPETETFPDRVSNRREKKTGYRCQFCGVIRDEPLDVCDVCQAIGAFEIVTYYE